MTDAIEQVTMTVLPDGRVSRADAAKYLGRKPETLMLWSRQKRGPAPVMVNGRAFYWLADLRAFARGETCDANDAVAA